MCPGVSMFEKAVKTDGDAGIIAWWKDVDNNAYIGFDTKNHNWYLRTIINGCLLYTSRCV